MSGKYGDLIREARKPESQKDGLLVNEQEGKAESTFAESAPLETAGNESDVSENKQVNLSIKVPESWRRHWVSEAKRQGTSLTAEITEALKNKFGLPER